MENMENLENIILQKEVLETDLFSKKIPALIFLLKKSSNHTVKNKIALLLSDIGDDRALPPLINEILKPSNNGYRGTLVYACESFDCSDYIDIFFKLLISSGNYEVAMTSMMVIEKMKILENKHVLIERINQLEEVLNNNTADYNELVEDMIFILTTKNSTTQ